EGALEHLAAARRRGGPERDDERDDGHRGDPAAARAPRKRPERWERRAFGAGRIGVRKCPDQRIYGHAVPSAGVKAARSLVRARDTRTVNAAAEQPTTRAACA